MKQLLILITILVSKNTFCQELTGNELLEKAIQYHDPNGNWSTFTGNLFITMEIPKKPNRDSEVSIDLPNEFFSVKSIIEDEISEYIINKDSITIIFNGDKNPSKEILETHRLSEKRAKLFQNYYTYLYGLPMKLKDKGTIIHENVETRNFKGKPYWVLKVTYAENVGKDTWYFYFNKDTFAMEVYQFFHDTSKNDGEYILLSGEETVHNIKMPKTRAWFMNIDDKYLGTDILKQVR